MDRSVPICSADPIAEEAESDLQRPYRILLADNEETFLVSTARLLENKGWESVCVSDGGAATERLRQEYFDVLVADYKMPGNEELELLRTCSVCFPEVPVIVVTGYPSSRVMEMCCEQNIFGFVSKLGDIGHLLCRIEEAAEWRRARVARKENRALPHQGEHD